MSNINIGRDNSDSSFRYKMPRLGTKVEGRGNGIKTVLTNIVDISKALHVLPHYPTKYFGIELGAQSKFDKAREMGIVNGAHSAGDLAKLLDKFIATFVLCPTCKLPEIKMDIYQKSKIKIDCAACGHNSILKTAHKLATYIVKNPPDLLSGKSGKKEGGEDDGSEEGEVVVETKAKKKGVDKKEKKIKKGIKPKSESEKNGKNENGQNDENHNENENENENDENDDKIKKTKKN